MKRTLAPLAVLAMLTAGCTVSFGGASDKPSESSVPSASASYSEPPMTEAPTPEATESSFSVPSGDTSELAHPRGALGDSGNSINQISLESVTAYAAAVIKDADKVWSTWMVGRGYPEPYVSYHLIEPGQPLQVGKACAVPVDAQGDTTTTIDSKFPNAFYCDGENNGVDQGTLILPVESLARMWSGDIMGHDVSNTGRVGDFAAATVIAHEFGHHVQAELTEDTRIPAPQGKNGELIADCFAGVWATVLYEEGGLEDGDLDEALNALEAMGDKPGLPGKFPHGTGTERGEAFRYGIYGSQADPRGGVPGICIRRYWPEFTGQI